MSQGSTQMTLTFTADTSQAKKELKDLQNTLLELTQIASKKQSGDFELTKEIREASTAAASLKAHLDSAMNVKTGKLDLGLLNKSLKDSGTTLQDYANKLKALGPDGTKAFTQLSTAILKADAPLRQTNKLLQDMSTTFINAAKWQISSSVLHGFMGSLQTAYYYAKDLNESLNDIRIVTGQSTDQMAAFAEQANSAAKALSTTTVDYAKASLIYYQQGTVICY